ncbi:MAG: hypothetical protein U5L09_09975 [Bacteroidales bacterium]|nr:hypothetical protein [Bacteroidales bacterium]
MSDGSWENNKVQWLFGAFVVVLLLILKTAALPLIILGYIIAGALVNMFNNDTKQR